MPMLVHSADASTPHFHTPYRIERHETTPAWGVDPSSGVGFDVTGAIDRERAKTVGDSTGALESTRFGAMPTRDERRERRDHRLDLLARKYGRAAFSREDQARLTILNERLNAVAQRVSEHDIAALERASQDLADTNELLQSLRERYGIEA